MEHVLFQEQTKQLSEVELTWDPSNEVLFIYGSIPQMAGIWAFALGGMKHKGSAWRIEYSGAWIECEPQEMPCFPWLSHYPEAQPWLSSIHPAVRSLWNQGMATSMVINRYLYTFTQEMLNPHIHSAWCTRFMNEMTWDQLFDELSVGEIKLKRDLSLQHPRGRSQSGGFEPAKGNTWADKDLLQIMAGRSNPTTKGNVYPFKLKPRHHSQNKQASNGAVIRHFPRRKKTLLNPIQNDFPPPPFEPTSEVSAVTNLKELAADTNLMGFSAKSYLFRIIDGFYYIYVIRVSTEQATLGVIQRNSRWYGDILIGQDGKKPSVHIMEKAAEWLKINGSRFIL